MADTWLTYKRFEELLDADFTARVDGSDDVTLKLVEATDTGMPGGVAADGRARTQFSIVFRGPTDVPLQQGTYAIKGDDFAEQLIFLVPIRADSAGVYYEAVFA